MHVRADSADSYALPASRPLARDATGATTELQMHAMAQRAMSAAKAALQSRGWRVGESGDAVSADAFWAKVLRGPDSSCWPWQGYVKPNGHGLTSYKSCPIHASRKAWILTHGMPHWDDCVLHRCDNPLCCNPAHLYLGSRADNMIDRFSQPPAEARTARGRRTILDDAQLQRLWEMRRSGATLAACAATFDVHIATICRYITAVRKQKLERNRAARLSVSQNRV